MSGISAPEFRRVQGFAHYYCCLGCTAVYTEEQMKQMGKSLDDDPLSCPKCEPDDEPEAA